MKIASVSKIVYIGLFLSMLIVPLIFTNTQKSYVSDFDNRTLVEFPEIGTIGFESAVEAYLQDRLGFRDQMVTGYQVLNDRVAHELTHPIYTYGQDGYMFFKMHDNIEFGDYHLIFADAIIKMKDYCEDRGIPFYFVFDPEKISVYRRYLPFGVCYNDEWVDELLNYLEEHDVKVINNRDLLIEKSYDAQVFNRQYDAGHWNDLGCFYGTNNLWNTVSKDFPDVTEYSMDEFDIETGIGEYLAASKFAVNEEIPIFNPEYEWDDLTTEFKGFEQNQHFPFFAYYRNTTEGANALPKALVFHGSYYNRGPKFLVGRTSEYIGIHAYQNVLNLPYYINIFNPDLVVFETAEYTVISNYYDSSTMASIDYNPALSASDVETCEELELSGDGIIEVIVGEKYDHISVSDLLPNTRYVYVVLNDDNDQEGVADIKDATIETIDLRMDSNGKWYTDVLTGTIKDSATVVYIAQDGKKYDIKMSVSVLKDLMDIEDITMSDGVSLDGNSYVFKTALDGNVFDHIDVQKYSQTNDEYLGLISTTNTVGDYNDSFIWDEESGVYIIRAKANSNIADQYVDFLVRLEKGERYYVEFTVDYITGHEVKISGFKLLGKE